METTLYCYKCNENDIDESDTDERTREHFGCGGRVEEVCEACLGTGEVIVDEQVYSGEPHTAPIGSKPCSCQITKDEYNDQD